MLASSRSELRRGSHHTLPVPWKRQTWTIRVSIHPYTSTHPIHARDHQQRSKSRSSGTCHSRYGGRNPAVAKRGECPSSSVGSKRTDLQSAGAAWLNSHGKRRVAEAVFVADWLRSCHTRPVDARGEHAREGMFTIAPPLVVLRSAPAWSWC